MMEIDVGKVLVNPEQPRKTFDPESLAELADSIREHGIIQAITVEEADDGYYILHDGERRVRAARMAGLKQIPAMITPRMNGNGSLGRLERALVANIQRDGMNSIEEARAFARLRDEHGMGIREIGEKIGKKGAAGYSYVRNRLIWLEMDPEIQELVGEGRLTSSRQVALALMNIPQTRARVSLAKRLAERRVGIPGCISACERVAKQIEEKAEIEGTPGLRLARQKCKMAATELPDWDALKQAGKVPPWPVVEKATRETCENCVLREMASPVVCSECGVVDLLCRLMRAK